ncbi:sugar O-acetyltransferase [Mariniphaga sediminis]|uniref:sugar O-acetyltransferase n=1 Tax=Mariniphaga sediminis TaxID=1628158 RepID=UPI0035642246
MTEKEKMLTGELYMGSDPVLSSEHLRSLKLWREFNSVSPEDKERKLEILKKLCPNQGTNVWISGPFYCDYGYNIHFGNNIYINFNCTILDVNKVTIGNDVLIGPSVEIYTAAHPMDWEERATRIEYGKPVTIGNNVWIGGNTTICPGVTIGDRSVIGAGSVVTKDIPEDVVAAGNPARVIRHLK